MEPARTNPPVPHQRRLPAWTWAAGLVALACGTWLLLFREPAAPPAEPPAPRTERGASPPSALESPSAALERAQPPGTSRSTAARSVQEPAEVRGVVLDETERPLAGAELVLSAVDPAAVRGIPFADGERLAA